MTQKQEHAIVLVAILLVSAASVGMLLPVGWIPNDEGTLAMSAGRVLSGQLAHKDFSEIYTGGLSCWHALVFRILGQNLFSLRLAIFGMFLLWVPAVYYLASRFLSASWAGIATLTAVAWSYPNYVAAMPSWYNLFLATFANVCLMHWLTSRLKRWLVAAGAFAGLSILVKITALYFVAAVLLFGLWMEQEESIGKSAAGTKHSDLYRLTCGMGVLCLLGAILRIVGLHPGFAEVYHFLVPTLMCVVMLLLREQNGTWRASSARFRALLQIVFPFLLGLTAVLAVYSIPYMRRSSLSSLLHGVFSSAAQRLAELAGRDQAPGVAFLPYGLVVVLFVLCAFRVPSRWKHGTAWIVGTILIAVLLCSSLLPGLQDTWLMAGMLTPLIVFAASCLRLRAEEALLVFAAALCSLVQFPLAYVTYFCYIAPLVLLAGVATVSALRRQVPAAQERVLGVLLVFFLGLGVFGVVMKHTYDPNQHSSELHRLPFERAGTLRVDDPGDIYSRIVPFLQQHAVSGRMYAGNDCPELYFLAGLQDITRDDTGAPVRDALAALKSGQIDVVVLNDKPFLPSSTVPSPVRAATEEMFPHMQVFGKFSVFWRETPSTSAERH